MLNEAVEESVVARGQRVIELLNGSDAGAKLAVGIEPESGFTIANDWIAGIAGQDALPGRNGLANHRTEIRVRITDPLDVQPRVVQMLGLEIG